MQRLKRLVWIGLWVYGFTLLGVVVLAQLAHRLAPHPLPPADAVVVLSSGLTPQGRLSAFSRGRTDTGIDLIQAGLAPRLVVTGGPNPSSHRMMADLMADRAVASGIARSRIDVEPAARSTLQNAKFSGPYLAGSDHILLVTDRFHLARSWVSFRIFWAGKITLVGTNDAALAQHAPWWEWVIVYGKEPLAIWFNVLRVPIWWVVGVFGLPLATQDALLA